MKAVTLSWSALLICCHAATGQSANPEGAPTGPNFSGEHTLIGAQGDLRGIAAKQLRIAQTENGFTVIEISSDGRSKSGRFPFSAEFVDDGGKAK